MAVSYYKTARKWLLQTAPAQYYREFQLRKNIPNYCINKNSIQPPKSNHVVFLCPANDTPIGGIKVIFNQSAIINSLEKKLEASILFPMNPKFKCTWFNHDAIFKNNLEFNLQNDFVMIPEFWAVPHARLLHALGIKYGIYVQNGYSIAFNSGKELDAAYRNAALILGISEDTVDCIKMAFPECSDRVCRVHCSVNTDTFTASHNKENIICYMPRKLKNHTQLVRFFLSKHLPENWEIVSIDGLTEDGVAAILAKSRIFLSFAEFEGLSLPPIEAALSGCYVIGYTGEAAKEYWDSEIFTEIHTGDIKAFANAILSKINEIDLQPTLPNTLAIQSLAIRYSAKIELADMRMVSNKLIAILNTHTPTCLK